MLTYTCEGCGITVQRKRGDEGRGRFCSIACGRKAQPMKSREERFWAKVDRRGADDCWPWTGTRNPKSYGILVSGPRSAVKRELAHRVSWELANGRRPVGAVCHTCDNPPCVRPDHLYEGTPATNAHDREAHGRTGQTRVSVTDVRLMRGLRDRGWTCQRIGDEFGISTEQAWAIVTRRAWKHVD